MENLLQNLKLARWDTASRTYGNDHSTLVGLLVDWWLAGQPTRWALEGGCSFGHLPKGKGGGICDALLCEGDDAVGVVEVEGARLQDTLAKIGKFFDSKDSDTNRIRFGIFLAYAYEPNGTGKDRRIPQLPLEDIVSWGLDVTRANPGKPLAVLALNKDWNRAKVGIRARNQYYQGQPSVLLGCLLVNGMVVDDDFRVSLKRP